MRAKRGVTSTLKTQMTPRQLRNTKRRAWLLRRSRRVSSHRNKLTRSRGAFGRRFVIKPAPRVSRTLHLPKILSLREDLTGAVNFFKSLENAFEVRGLSTITIDHTRLQSLSPEAALVLLAEFARLNHHFPQVSLFARGTCGSAEVEDLLDCIGYNDRFSIKTNRPNIRRSRHRSTVTYVKARSGVKISMDVVTELVDHFQRLVGFSEVQAERLMVSLGELMNNVTQHAYPEELQDGRRWGRKCWWLLGYTDESCRQVYFALLDQGVGLPMTLKPKWRDVDLLLIPRSEAEMVMRAFSKRRSRTNQEHRGRGLTTLRRYIHEARSGELFTQTAQVECCFFPQGARPMAKSTQVPLAGTLMVWHVEDTSNGDEQYSPANSED